MSDSESNQDCISKEFQKLMQAVSYLEYLKTELRKNQIECDGLEVRRNTYLNLLSYHNEQLCEITQSKVNENKTPISYQCQKHRDQSEKVDILKLQLKIACSTIVVLLAYIYVILF